MAIIEYMHVNITDAPTGNIISIIPCAQCKQNEKDCPVYQDALQYSSMLHINIGHTQIGNKIVTIGFPRSYGEVLRKHEIERWQKIAKQCESR